MNFRGVVPLKPNSEKIKMKYEELRNEIQNHPKYDGCVKIDRSPLIHAGFPGNFNLSFTEYPWLQKFGRYIDFDRDYVFSTVQSCIRPQDIPSTGTEDSWKYLGVFEMADLNGAIALKDKPNYEEVYKKQVFDFVNFLENHGISRERVYPSYCAGGSVKELTRGKYNFDFQIPEDSVSKESFLEAGIPETNLIKDRSRDTLLSLNLKQEGNLGKTILSYSPWGYRNEINIKMQDGKLLDVATLERFEWNPIWAGEEIQNLGRINSGASILGVGLERFCMVVNNLQRVQDVDSIKPFYDEMLKQTGGKNYLAGESLRALHRIYSDLIYFNINDIRRHKKSNLISTSQNIPLDLGKNRRSKINKLTQNIPRDLDYSQINALLQVHSETQLWHPEMKDGIEPTIERIKIYRGERK